MGTKPIILLFIFIGGTIGGFIPSLWGDTNPFSFVSIITGGIGSVLGIYAGFKVSSYME